jgi:hypothetical protein
MSGAFHYYHVSLLNDVEIGGMVLDVRFTQVFRGLYELLASDSLL